jgi:hypothetical protein
MKVRDVFLKDPCRTFERVIKINEIDPEKLGQDLEDYVVTDEIRQYFEDILDEFIESRRSQPEWVCAWVNGYFGSGKSHFLKALAAILGNLSIQLPGRDNRINTLDYFPSKWRLPYSELLKKEFVVKTVVINLLYPKTQESPPLSRIIFREFMKQQGFANTPWVAEVERQLKLDGLFNKFKQKIEETEEKPWKELRETPLYTRNVMAKVLPQVDLDRFPDEEKTFKVLEDQEKHLQITPEWLAERLKEEAMNLHSVKGRVVLLLDEVGLYVADSHDRMTELQAIAETISQEHIRSKIWLIVTAQEALEEKIPGIARKAEEFQKLRDRFRMKAALTPENITTVVQKRLLEKNISAAVQELRKRFIDNSGTIATGALLKGISRDIDFYTKLPQEKDFKDYYPFLPYQVSLIQRILEVLRGKEYGAEGLTGRERSVLGIVQGALCQGDISLRDADIGSLVTFDLIFDAMEQEVQTLRGTEVAVIKKLRELDERENLPIQRIAKSLYLLQQVRQWLPTTPENVASILYERIGQDAHQKLQEVNSCLKVLVREHYVAEREGKYRFLQEVERTFEQEVERFRQRIPNIQKQELTREVIKEKLRDLQKIRYKDTKDFEIKIEIDDEIAFAKGYLVLKVTSPLNATDIKLDELEMETAREKNELYLSMAFNPNFNEKIERTLALDKALNERKKKSPLEEETRFLRERETDLDRLRHDELPQEALESLRTGRLIFKGQRVNLEGRDWNEAIKRAIADCIADTFYEFDEAAARVREDEIVKIITSTGGVLPQCYHSLKIIDASGNIREDSPLLSDLLLKIRDLIEKHDPRRTGHDLEGYFTSPPYGWDPRVIRLGLASLLKRGSISVQVEGKHYTAEEPGVIDIFRSFRRFSSALFELGVTLTLEEERKASNLLAEVFSEHGKETPAEIWEALQLHLELMKEKSNRLLQRLRDLRLGASKPLKNLSEMTKKILEQSSSELAIKDFISDETIPVFRSNIKIYNELIELSENRKLDQIAHIKRFADIAKDDELNRLLLSDEFPLKWDTLIQTFHQKENKYKDEYSLLHDKNKKAQSKAVEIIWGHRAFKEKREEAEKIIETHSSPFQCDAAQVQWDENWTCSHCQLSLNDLKTMHDRIERWKSAVLQKLEFLLLEKLKGKAFLSEEMEITSLSDISSLEAKIHAFANRILERGKRLRALLKMEEK